MRKLLILLLLLLLLVACGSAADSDATTNIDSGDTAAPAETSGGETTEEISEDSPAQTDAGPVVTGSNPQEASVVRVQDHTKGADNPTVTIIEYGDFQ